jgi:hypothetical protein
MWEHYNTVNTLVKVFLQTQRRVKRRRARSDPESFLNALLADLLGLITVIAIAVPNDNFIY